MEKCGNSESILPFSCCPLIFSQSKTGKGEGNIIRNSLLGRIELVRVELN